MQKHIKAYVTLIESYLYHSILTWKSLKGGVCWSLLSDQRFYFCILNRYLDGSPLPPDWQVFPVASSKNIFDSSVRLARVDSKHSGQYECQPSHLQSAIINLHVVKGKLFFSYYSKTYFVLS